MFDISSEKIKIKKSSKKNDIDIKNIIKEPKDYDKVDINLIDKIPDKYPEEFNKFCKKNKLTPPSLNSGNGKALAIMLDNKYKYFTRSECDEFIKKFNIESKDSIQLFNKHSQWGIKTNSGIEKGKLYIVYPYDFSSKHNMRKNFTYNGTKEEKDLEIEKIKSTIKHDYVDIPNEKWQLGHKNPSNITENNLVLQPPIQQKYRDDYIFIDTLTKIPLSTKLKNMLKNKEIVFTTEQIDEYYELFSSLKK